MSQQVDLQAVAIEPLKPKIKVKAQTTVKVFMKNNGPGEIPKKQGVFHVTVGGKFLNKPSGVKSPDSLWALQGPIISKDGKYELYFHNTSPIPVNDGSKDIEVAIAFYVKGKKAGKAEITLASSLSADAEVSDADGNNQAVTTEIIVQ